MDTTSFHLTPAPPCLECVPSQPPLKRVTPAPLAVLIVSTPSPLWVRRDPAPTKLSRLGRPLAATSRQGLGHEAAEELDHSPTPFQIGLRGRVLRSLAPSRGFGLSGFITCCMHLVCSYVRWRDSPVGESRSVPALRQP